MSTEDEIERLEFALAAVSVDHGRGLNPCKLDVPFMERRLALLRAYRDIEATDADMDAVMAKLCSTQFGNFAETDPKVASIRADILTASHNQV